MKICPVGTELFHADGRQTDGRMDGQKDDEANSHFSQFGECA
jgi:hypothetical protein